MDHTGMPIVQTKMEQNASDARRQDIKQINVMNLITEGANDAEKLDIMQ